MSVYLAVTALPYLAVSPASDVTYGALNACLLTSTRERLGFAVAPDNRAAVAWSGAGLVECVSTDAGTVATKVDGHVYAAAYAHDGTLFLSTARGLEARLDGGAVTLEGHVGANDVLVGTDVGVVLYDGEALTSLKANGEALGSVPLHLSEPWLRASGDGRRLATREGIRLRVFDSHTLESVFDGSPCETKGARWLEGARQLLVDCGDVTLVLDVESGHQDTSTKALLPGSWLAGPRGPTVEDCDRLPRTAQEAR